jgi:hypothetical protein
LIDVSKCLIEMSSRKKLFSIFAYFINLRCTPFFGQVFGDFKVYSRFGARASYAHQHRALCQGLVRI